MTQEAVLRDVLDRLEAVGIEYMIVGSMASSRWGRPRATQDADVVIQTDLARLQRFIRGATGTYYIPEGLAMTAIRNGGMFNVIHSESAFKTDLIVSDPTPQARGEFERRRQASWLGRSAWFADPVDVIIAKLQWFAKGGGERQLADCAGVVEIQGTHLDRAKLEARAQEVGVSDLLERVLPPR